MRGRRRRRRQKELVFRTFLGAHVPMVGQHVGDWWKGRRVGGNFNQLQKSLLEMLENYVCAAFVGWDCSASFAALFSKLEMLKLLKDSRSCAQKKGHFFPVNFLCISKLLFREIHFACKSLVHEFVMQRACFKGGTERSILL